jgi:capsular exopolysaccharide synthesis family protein
MNSPTDSASFSDTLANDTASRRKRSRTKKLWAGDVANVTDVAPTFKLREPIAPATPTAPTAPTAPARTRSSRGETLELEIGHDDGESIRLLYSQLQLIWFNSGERTVLALIDAGARAQQASVAARLAKTSAAAGQRTLLIDADLRAPRLHTLFDVENTRGLSSVLACDTSLDDALAPTRFDALTILPAGPACAWPEALLSKARIAQVLGELAGKFDVVLIDTPGTSAHADAQIIASAAGGALVTVRRHRTRARVLEQLATDLRGVEAAIVGATFVEP